MMTPISPGTRKFALRSPGLKSTRGRTSSASGARRSANAVPIATAAAYAGCAIVESEPSISTCTRAGRAGLARRP